MPNRTAALRAKDNRDDAIAALVRSYTPQAMTPGRWVVCAAPVRQAVLATRPGTRGAAGTYLATLCRFLNSPCGWDAKSQPDLAALLTDENIKQHANTLSGANTRIAARGQLRAISRAIGALPARQVLPNPHPRIPDPLLAAGARLPIPVAILAAACARAHRRPLPVEPFKAVVAALRREAEAAAKDRSPGTVSLPAVIRALAGANDQPVKDTVTSKRGNIARGTTRPLSRRAAVAHAKAAMAAAQAVTTSRVVAEAPQVSPEVADAVSAYTPHKANRAAWVDNQTVAHRLVLGYRPASPRNARNVCSHVACFLTWFANWPGRTNACANVDLTELLTAGVIEAYVAASSHTDRSRASVRSTMRRAIGSLNPDAQPLKVARPPVAAPYTPAECARIVRLAQNQPTNAATASMSFIVGLGLGAGLDTKDLRHLTAACFNETRPDAGPAVLTVTVQEDRRRTVPVRDVYAPLVRRALSIHAALGKARDDLILGKVADRTNVVDALSRAKSADPAGVLQLRVGRLRNTWLVAAMCAPMPLAEVLRAAGLGSARTLTDLLPFCPKPDDAAVAGALAMMRDQLNPEGDPLR
jgi:hypothetical protein